MAEFFVDTRGEFGLEEWGAMLARFPKHAERAVASGLRSEGSRLQRLIKRSIQAGGPPGQPWAPLHPHTLAIMAAKKRRKRWASREAQGKTVRASTRAKYRGHGEIDPGNVKPLRKLAGAARYYYDDAIKTVTIGFLDPKNKGLAKMHAAGFTKTVDRRMGRLLAAYGFPVKTGTVLRVPGRPVVGPVFDREKATIRKNIQENTINNIYRYLTGKPKDWDKA
jgi:hypothetical protein